MSFSFNLIAPTKGEARSQVAAKMAEIVVQQPCHAVDLPLVLQVANAYINVLPDDPTQNVSISVNGYISWAGTNVRETLCSASIGVTASAVLRAL